MAMKFETGEMSVSTRLSSSSVVGNYLAECNTGSLSTNPLVNYWSSKVVTHPALA